MAVPTRITELVNTIAGDSTLRERFSAAADDAARVEILASIGFGDVTTAEVRANAQAFLPVGVEEIDDAQLASVAGGGDTITTVTTTTTVTASASAAVAT